MNFLVDENLGRSIVRVLEQLGHDVMWATSELPGAPDVDVMARAHQEQRVIVSDDTDFGTLVFRDRLAAAGVILLRMPGLRKHEIAARLAAAVQAHARELLGSFIVLDPENIRIRALPGPSTS